MEQQRHDHAMAKPARQMLEQLRAYERSLCKNDGKTSRVEYMSSPETRNPGYKGSSLFLPRQHFLAPLASSVFNR